MTPAQGQKRIKALLGPKAAWRDNCVMTSADMREQAKAEVGPLKTAYDALRTAREQRLAELMRDPELVRLTAETRTARLAWEQVQWRTHGYRLTVGTIEGIGLFVKAEGDNWADVVRKLEAKAS